MLDKESVTTWLTLLVSGSHLHVALCTCPSSHLVLQIHYRLLQPMSPTSGPYMPAAKIIFHQSATNGRRVRPTLPSAISWAWVLPVGWAPSPLAETCPARSPTTMSTLCGHFLQRCRVAGEGQCQGEEVVLGAGKRAQPLIFNA